MDTREIVPRRGPAVLALLAVLAATACSGSGDDDDAATPTPPTTLTVTYVFPASPDPLAGIGAWRVTVTSAGNTVVAEEFAEGDPVELRVDPMANASLQLEGCVPEGCAAGVVSRGRTRTFDITGEEQTVSMWFARTNTFSSSNGTYLARSRPAVFPFPDGRVLLAGGSAPGPVTNVDVYDPVIDSVSPGPALPLGNADWVVVPLDTRTLLLAGGRNAASAIVDAAMVFTYDEGAIGSWTIAAPMSSPRDDASGAPIGNRRALIVGGTGAVNMRRSTEAFRWDGVLGSWEIGADLALPLVGATVLQVGTNAALVAGGFSIDMAVESFTANVALFTSSGGAGWTQASVGTLSRTRSHAGVLPLGPAEWLLVGGWRGANPPYLPTRVSERIVLDPLTSTTATVSTAARTTFGQAHGGGALTGDGRYLFVGGDAASKDAPPNPLDEAVFYDPIADELTSAGATPGETVHAGVVPLADGTTLVVTDLGVFRFNP